MTLSNRIVVSASERLAQSRERLRQAMRPVDAAPDQANWDSQALRLGVKLSKDAAQIALQPTANRHPYGLVVGAAAVGGLIVLARPWRWISTSGLLAGCLPEIMSVAMKYLPEQSVSASDEHV
jgi:hypothetical protein